MSFQKNLGLLFTGIFLLIFGIPVIIPALTINGIVAAIVAVIAGILLILGR